MTKKQQHKENVIPDVAINRAAAATNPSMPEFNAGLRRQDGFIRRVQQLLGFGIDPKALVVLKDDPDSGLRPAVDYNPAYLNGMLENGEAELRIQITPDQ